MNLLGRALNLNTAVIFDLDPREREALATAESAEDVAGICLEWMVDLINPIAAHAYLYDRQEGRYRLTAAFTPSSSQRPEPDYSGLTATDGSSAVAPLSLELPDVPARPEVVNKGGDRWLLAPVGTTLFIRLHLDRHQKMSRENLAQISGFANAITPVLALAQRLAESRADAERAKASLAAARVAAETALRPQRSLELLFQLPMGLLGAPDGGLIIAGVAAGGSVVAASHGRGASLCHQILAGRAPYLVELPPEPDLVDGEALGALREHGCQAVLRIPAIHGDQAMGCAYYFFPDRPDLSEYQQAVLSTVGDRFAQVVSANRVMTETAEQYMTTLRSLVSTMDGTARHTTGHSDRMARYARMVARELGLPLHEVEAIAMGAYLHDVGMVAIDMRLINKEGRLSADEYGVVQSHTHVGAELVSTFQAALPIAPMVAHHHERWDGRGYPHRLTGKEIPLGARIIAVCDLFEAKTTGRAYRKPLPFERALADVQAAAGTQLDPDIVAAFVRAWRSLRQASLPGRPLARCYELKQVPAVVCGSCPNRHAIVPQACWQNRNHLCDHHGDECATCVVYTEALSRMDR